MSDTKSTSRRAVDGFTDWRGHPIIEGSRVFYPRMSGRCVEVVEGVVLECFETANGYERERWEPRIAIRAERSSRFAFGTKEANSWSIPGRITISIIKNVTVVPR